MKKEEQCCPKFDSAPWDGKIIEWKDKKFIKDKVFTLFHVPIGFGNKMKNIDAMVKKSGAEMQQNLCLSDHTSMWNMDLYVAVSKEIPGAKNVTLSGKYFSKVYDGDFNKTGQWCKDFEKIVNKKGYKIVKWYMCYTTCPACAKKYGHNYVLIIGKIK